jgi:hypothetical protein
MVKKGVADDDDDDDEWEPMSQPQVHVTVIQGTEDLALKSQFK